jgi:hypothetical protein
MFGFSWKRLARLAPRRRQPLTTWSRPSTIAVLPRFASAKTAPESFGWPGPMPLTFVTG